MFKNAIFLSCDAENALVYEIFFNTWKHSL